MKKIKQNKKKITKTFQNILLLLNLVHEKKITKFCFIYFSL